MVQRNLYDFHANKKWQKCLKRFSIFSKRFVRENKQRPCKLQIYNTRFSWKTHARQTVYYKCTHIQILYFIYVQRLQGKILRARRIFIVSRKAGEGGDVKTVNENVSKTMRVTMSGVLCERRYEFPSSENIVRFIINRFSSRRRIKRQTHCRPFLFG